MAGICKVAQGSVKGSARRATSSSTCYDLSARLAGRSFMWLMKARVEYDDRRVVAHAGKGANFGRSITRLSSCRAAQSTRGTAAESRLGKVLEQR